MRTWTLERQWSGSIVVGGNTEKLSIHSPVEVIELEPVLDLLERLLPLPRGFPGEGCGDSDEAPILDLLRAHLEVERNHAERAALDFATSLKVLAKEYGPDSLAELEREGQFAKHPEYDR